MKSLYINNKRVILDSENTYFPFSYKISDLENINIIGVPVSKTIEIPRIVNNDEIFGYIGELTRIVVGDTNNLIGISFNQTKKAFYKLYDDNEIISEGTLIVTDVNDSTYSISLFDILIEKLESINGNSDTGEGYLNELDIILNNSSIFSEEAYAINVEDLIINNSEVKPCANIKDFAATGTDCYISVDGEYSTHTLSSDMTPIQFKSLKPYDFEYSMPISTVIRSINEKYDLITYDSKLNSLFDDVHFSCGVPKHILTQEDYIVSGLTFSTFNYQLDNAGSHPLNSIKKANINNIGYKNGQYYLEVPLILEIVNKDLYGNILPTFNLCSKITDWSAFSNRETPYTDYCFNYNVNTAKGTYMGSLFVDIKLTSFESGTTSRNYSSKTITNEIKLFKGVNVIEELDINGKIIKLTVQAPNGIIPLTYDYYILTQNPNVENYLEFDFSNFGLNESLNTGLMLFSEINYGGYVNTRQTITPSFTDIKINYKSVDFRTGDILNGKTLFPKISIKDFIVEMTKYFNLSLKIVDGKLNLKYKEYYVTSDVPIINTINSLDINNFDFSKLTLKNEVTSNKSFADYKTYTKKTYGEKIINTGYNIKINNKDIVFNISTPALIRDVNNYAYDIFAGYFNGGYSKHLNGVTQGLEDKLVFGFINIINEDIYCADDTQFEAGLISTNIQPEEISFILSNKSLIYNSDLDTYTFRALDVVDVKVLHTHYTLSPYKFDENNIILKSLEINKPLYNFANITDEIYSENVTLYSIYHKKRITDIYNVNTHILDVNMYIDGLIDEKKIYNYNNSQYIINEVPEYDPTQPNLYDIKLLRVNDVNNYLNQYGEEYSISEVNTIVMSGTSISVNFSVVFNGNDTITESGIVYNLTGTPKTSDNKIINAGELVNSTILITGVTSSVNYYIRSYSINSIGTSYSDEQIFYSLGVPVLTSDSIINITNTGATGNATILNNGGTSIIEQGYVIDIEPLISYDDDANFVGTTGLTFVTNITSLIENTLYYAKAYAINSIGIGYGNLLSFNTKGKGIVFSNSAYNITTTSVKINSNILSVGGGNVTGAGICYSTSANPTTANNKVLTNTEFGLFTSFITGLTANTLYYTRAYVVNEFGTGYSNQISFTSLNNATPTLLTVEPTIYATEVYSGGEIISNGGVNITAKGIIWTLEGGGDPSLSNYDGLTDSGSGSTNFVSIATGLSPDTIYMLRAYATNSIGTGYGAIIQITTDVQTGPIIYTTPITSITTNGCQSGGYDINDGGSLILEKGLIWSTLDNLDVTTYQGIIANPFANGDDFTSIVTGLYPGQLYYLRSYATNSIGTGLGAILNFRTDEDTPVVETVTGWKDGLTNYFVGNIISDGGLYTTRGFVYSNSESTPTVGASGCYTVYASGDGVGEFTSNFINASSLYFRAYGENELGFGYGDVLTV